METLWRAATSPSPPPGAVGLVDVSEAVLTPLRGGDLRTDRPPFAWFSGAVHRADGALVPESQRVWSGELPAPVAADPPHVAPSDAGPRLEGTWIYGGHFTRHFGHFLLEAITNLWPDPAALSVDGVLFHRSFRALPVDRAVGHRPPQLSEWHVDLLDLAGYGGVPVLTVQGRRLRVQRLLVPSRPVALLAWAEPQAVELWRRMAGRVPVSHRSGARVFFSRRAFHQESEGWHVRSDPEWDGVLDREMAAAGFTVIRPEELTIREQISVVRAAGVLAGASGSALHLSAFAEPGTRVLEIGDSRSDGVPLPSQRLIDAACGHQAAFVDYRDLAGLRATLSAI